MEEKQLLVGYAREKINPPMGIKIPGHGFMPRPSDGIIDDVHIYALAFSDGENKAVLFNVDALGILSKGGERIRNKVAERCGIPAAAAGLPAAAGAAPGSTAAPPGGVTADGR